MNSAPPAPSDDPHHDRYAIPVWIAGGLVFLVGVLCARCQWTLLAGLCCGFAILFVVMAFAVLTPAQIVTPESAKLALDRMKEWSTWLTGIQTGAIAALVLAVKSDLPAANSLAMTLLQLAATFLAVSVGFFTWLLGALPSIHLRLKSYDSGDNDIYTMRIFHRTPIKLQFVAGCSHVFGIAGFVFYGWFFIATLKDHKPPKEEHTVVVQGLDKSLTLHIVPPSPSPPPSLAKESTPRPVPRATPVAPGS